MILAIIDRGGNLSRVYKLKSIKDDEVMQEVANKFFDVDHEDYTDEDIFHKDDIKILKIEKEFEINIDSMKANIYNNRKVKKEAEQEEKDRREFERLKRKFEK